MSDTPELPVIPYQPSADYRGAPGVEYTGPTAPGAPQYPPQPNGAPPGTQPPPPYGPPPAGPPPAGPPPAPYGAPPPYRPPLKQKSNKGMIITLVVTIVVLIAAVSAWGLMRGFKRLQSDFGDSAAQSLVRDALSLEDRYFTSNKRFASASELASSAASTPRPRKFVDSDPRPPDEVKIATEGDDIVCITARSAGGTYWAAGVIVADGVKSTYYLDNQFSDPLAVCGVDTIKAGKKSGFPSPTRSPTRR